MKQRTSAAAATRSKKKTSSVIERSKKTPKATGSKKKPSDPREYPAARDSRGSASGQEIRRTAPKLTAPRQSQRPAERSGQKRSRRA